MLEKIVEQVILQAPAVGMLLYIMWGQDQRINELSDDLRDCLNRNKKDD